VLGECLLPSSFKGMDHRISQATQGESILSVDVVLVEFNFCYFPHNLVHATRFSGQYIGVAEGGGKFANCTAQKFKTRPSFHQQPCRTPENLNGLKKHCLKIITTETFCCGDKLNSSSAYSGILPRTQCWRRIILVCHRTRTQMEMSVEVTAPNPKT